MRRLILVCAWCLALVGGVMAEEAALPPATVETVRTEDGIVIVWHRAPALDTDLEMPLFANGMVLDSFVYRVRDRKKRDLMLYARASITTTAPTEDILKVYRKALGTDAQMETDKTTGEITLSSGTTEHFRLVTISPSQGYARLRLEHVQQFTVPPRVQSAEELRVIRVLEEVTAVYRSARRVAYHVEQRLQTGEEAPTAPALAWDIDFTRPDRLRLTAKVGEVMGLSVTAESGKLTVARQVGDPVVTPFEGKLTTELIPELHDDPVARLIFDDEPLSATADYLAILSMTESEAARIAEIVLTYPEKHTKLFLTIDLRSKLVLRSETEVPAGDNKATRMVRAYSAIVLDAVTSPVIDPTPSPLPSQPGAPAAVTGQ